jgi:hypothetical protein
LLVVSSVVSSVGCDQPKGVVISVSGASTADDLWLTVGDKANADKTRFFQRDGESGLLKSKAGLAQDVEFSDGFEIYLDSEGLKGQSQIALVLDAIVDGTPPDIRRDSYLVKPDSSGLVEVKLSPKEIGPGQWVCAGQQASDLTAGFIVSLDERDADCDRDGWSFREDSDDTDPLKAPKLTWTGLGLDCKVLLGTRQLQNVPNCNLCEEPQERDDFETCLATAPQIKCTVGTNPGVLSVAQIVRPVPSNPNWELIKLGPANAAAVFAPSIKAPSQWAVLVGTGALNVAWFQLNDRAEGGVSRLVRVEYKPGDATRCEQ